MIASLQDYEPNRKRFGELLARLRVYQGYSRAQLVNRLYQIMPYDEEFFALHVSEAWLRQLEEGRKVKIPFEILPLLFEALRCTHAQAQQLAECLVPTAIKPYLAPKAETTESYAPATIGPPPASPKAEKRSHRGRPKTEGLTQRQLEVLQMAAIGFESREIEEMLCITKATVDTHWKRILNQLGADDRQHAVKIALSLKLIEYQPTAVEE